MPSLGREMSSPRLWFVTVRLLEVAALGLLVGAVMELWAAVQSSDQYSPFGADAAAPAGTTLLRRVVTLAFYSGIFRAPVNLLLGAVLVALAVGILSAARPVSNFGVLRWELLVAWALTALVVLALLLVNVVALFGDSPFQSSDPNVISGNAGPGVVEQAIGGLSVPLPTALILAAVGLWWLRLPAEVDEPDHAAQPSRREPHRVAPPADLETMVLDGVEQIEPVERLQPREGGPGDGATASGYEDYLRKF